MRSSVDTVIVGAGQAGLALSRCLTGRGIDHLVLERGRVGERWRSERWDSFRMLSPNWHTRLPGHRYDGPDPDGFMDAHGVVRLLEGYARSFDAPVQDATSVIAVDRHPDGWRVRTDRGDVRCRNVVVATGPHDRPRIPTLADGLPAEVHQLHASSYRNPGQLPSGGVLVVGAGPTGQQLAGELARAGRRVHLAVGRHRRVPRRYRGRDAFWWMDALGIWDTTVDEVTDPREIRRPTHTVLSGSVEVGLDALVRDGVRPLGRLADVGGGAVRFDTGLAERYLDAEGAVHRFVAKADAHAAAAGLDLPPGTPLPPLHVPSWATRPATTLRLGDRDVATVLWATGYRRDHRWLHAPVFDRDGEPIHRRGVTTAPGLFFLGLSWQYRRKSASIDGVGDDARYLAEVIADRGSVTDGRVRDAVEVHLPPRVAPVVAA
jgi:putative flavoprotein involved in K+ transport